MPGTLFWGWLILAMVGVVIAVTILASRTKKTTPVEKTPTDQKEPCPTPSVLEKIVMTPGPIQEIIRYIRNEGSSHPVSLPVESVPDVSPILGFDHIIFLGSPTDALKSWVRTLPMVPNPVIIRIEPVKEVDATKRDLLSQLMALSHSEGEVVLVVDSKECALTSDDQFETPTLTQPCLYSSQPLVYGFHRKDHHAMMEILIGEYKRLVQDATYQVDLVKCMPWVSATRLVQDEKDGIYTISTKHG